MTLDDFLGKGATKKEKSQRQEKNVAKLVGGRATISSGSLHFDKADVVSKSFRIECKRTDKEFLRIDKKWLTKIKKEALESKVLPAVNIEINGEMWFMIRVNEFDVLRGVIEDER